MLQCRNAVTVGTVAWPHLSSTSKHVFGSMWPSLPVGHMNWTHRSRFKFEDKVRRLELMSACWCAAHPAAQPEIPCRGEESGY
mgnify:CR=1 FL=1